jgi:eukaryotic-like serine/threonine-protein kinase
VLKAGQRLGKYRIRRRLAAGGFAAVFEAHDTIEGTAVALKVPLGKNVRPEVMADFRKEARLAAKLEHPNVLQLKNADTIDGIFVIAYPLGIESLHERLSRRISVRLILEFAEQLLSALAHAHEHRVIHCDVKPENLIVFEDDRLRLTDFGIAKVAQRTIDASASGTVGYMAPEQAMGRPSVKSDVFSAGLVIYRLLTGSLPQWPFEWPLPGHARLRKVAPELEPILRKALSIDARKRFRDAEHMLSEFRTAKKKVLRRLSNRHAPHGNGTNGRNRDWRSIRIGQFRRRFSKWLRLVHTCDHCHNPVDERMQTCPWCGMDPLGSSGESDFPAACPRCRRGVKLDWAYCAWCYGPKIGPATTRSYSDRRYHGKCGNEECGKPLMPYMRYCPWCHARVRKRWKMGKQASPCGKCGQPTASGFWTWCPWCGTSVSRT